MDREKAPRRVLSIDRRPVEDEVKQAEFEMLRRMQDSIYQQTLELFHKLDIVRRRIGAGANQERGRYYFDRETMVVRSRKLRREGA